MSIKLAIHGLNRTDPPISTSKVDGGILLTVLLHSDNGTPSLSVYTDQCCSRLAAGADSKKMLSID